MYFDDTLDVRFSTEYALDHLPKALNFPVLDDEERAQVGTLYKKVSQFEAKKEGRRVSCSAYSFAYKASLLCFFMLITAFFLLMPDVSSEFIEEWKSFKVELNV